MSYESRVSKVNAALNVVSQVPEIVGAWFRVTGVLRAIRDADRAAANGDPGLRPIAKFGIPHGYGQHVHWRELKMDPNNRTHRQELGEIQRVLRGSLDWRNPARAIEASRFIDRKIVEANNGKL